VGSDNALGTTPGTLSEALAQTSTKPKTININQCITITPTACPTNPAYGNKKIVYTQNGLVVYNGQGARIDGSQLPSDCDILFLVDKNGTGTTYDAEFNNFQFVNFKSSIQLIVPYSSNVTVNRSDIETSFESILLLTITKLHHPRLEFDFHFKFHFVFHYNTEVHILECCFLNLINQLLGQRSTTSRMPVPISSTARTVVQLSFG